MPVRVSFMAAFAAVVLQGCENRVVAHCVDEQGVVVDDGECAELDGGLDAGADGAPEREPRHANSIIVVHHWWYGGYTPTGTRVTGGSFTVPAGVSPVTRGGFGTPGGAHAGAAGE